MRNQEEVIGTPPLQDGTAVMLPNLVIIGAMKCATTSLHYYLSLHPEIFMSLEKEINFFTNRNWPKGIDWYKSHFIKSSAKVYGESSPAYTMFPIRKGVPGRMHSVIPDAKLIYVLRDPVERIISDYVHCYASGIEERSIAEALDNLEASTYVSRSRYYMQLEQYLKYYPKHQILIITQENLFNFRQETLTKVFNFLEVEANFESKNFSKVQHQSNLKRRKTNMGKSLETLPTMKLLERLPYKIKGPIKTIVYWPFSQKLEKPKLERSLRESIISFLEDDIKKLEKYVGKEFNNWCI